MKKVFAFFGFVALVMTACSGPATNTVEQTNANVAVESPFANITDANAALAEGNRLFDENQTEMAIAAYRLATKLDPEFAEAYFRLGIAYSLFEMQLAQSGEITAPPSNSKEGKSKTNSEIAFEKAVAAYKKWITTHPTDDASQFNLGRTYAKLMKDEEAEEAFRAAVKIKPDDTEYQTELGAILIKLAKYREAIEPLKKAVALDETNARAQELLEDAEAGRQRLDYVAPKNTNTGGGNSNANSNANANANSNSSSNSNSSPKNPEANGKTKKDDPKKTVPPANKPGPKHE